MLQSYCGQIHLNQFSYLNFSQIGIKIFSPIYNHGSRWQFSRISTLNRNLKTVTSFPHHQPCMRFVLTCIFACKYLKNDCNCTWRKFWKRNSFESNKPLGWLPLQMFSSCTKLRCWNTIFMVCDPMIGLGLPDVVILKEPPISSIHNSETTVK